MLHWLFSVVALALAAPLAASDEDFAEDMLLARSDYESSHAAEDWPAAIDAAARMLDIASGAFRDADPRLATYTILYAKLVAEHDNPAAALVILDRRRRLFEVELGDDSIDLVPIIVAQGDVSASRMTVDVQKRYYEEALKITKREYGRKSIPYADLALDLGAKILTLSKSDDGLNYVKRAQAIYDDQLGKDAFQSGKAAFVLGVIQYARGYPKIARNHFENALLAFDAANDEHKSYYIRTREFLIEVLMALNDEEEASLLREELHQISPEEFPAVATDELGPESADTE